LPCRDLQFDFSDDFFCHLSFILELDLGNG